VEEAVTPTLEDLRPLTKALAPDLAVYRDTVSDAAWAISLETAALIEWACDRNDPVTVCDLGSGFTSYVLRKYAVGRGVVCMSVDTSPKWIAKTETFLKSHDLDTTNVIFWDKWRVRSDLYDLIVVDLEYGELRNDAIRSAPSRLNPGGVVIFDDSQNSDHLAAMLQAASDHGLTLDVLGNLEDDLGRFPAVAW
jgi:predicted O-methyltransferase YrrM